MTVKCMQCQFPAATFRSLTPSFDHVVATGHEVRIKSADAWAVLVGADPETIESAEAIGVYDDWRGWAVKERDEVSR